MSGSSVLEIAVGRALLHRRERSHAAVGLVGAPLEELDLARRFLGSREQAADHHHVGAGGDRLCDVAGVADAAVRDERHVGLGEASRHVGDRRDLRHADAGDDAGRADRARADADLDAVGAVIDQRLGAAAVATLPPITWVLGKLRLTHRTRFKHVLRVAVRGIHHDHVRAGLDHRRGALLGALAHPDRGADAQPAEPVLARVRDARWT